MGGAVGIHLGSHAGVFPLESQKTTAPPVTHVGKNYVKKVSRFLIVSAFNVAVGQSVLILAHSWLRWPFAASNVAAVTVSAGPAYILTRYWVWEKRTKNHVIKEVLPFWGLAFFGLIVSTIAAGIANTYTDAQIVLNLVNLLSFGVIWIFKFFILDRFMFGKHHHALEPAAKSQDAVTG